MILEDLNEEVEANMGESNIRSRKNRMAKDHLFVLYRIINAVVHNSKEESVDITIYDLEKAFDKLMLDEAINDLVNTLEPDRCDEKVSLLHKSNLSTKVSINTPFRQTERET